MWLFYWRDIRNRKPMETWNLVKIVMIISKNVHRNHWPMGIFGDFLRNGDGIVREILVRTSYWTLRREVRNFVDWRVTMNNNIHHTAPRSCYVNLVSVVLYTCSCVVVCCLLLRNVWYHYDPLMNGLMWHPTIGIETMNIWLLVVPTVTLFSHICCMPIYWIWSMDGRVEWIALAASLGVGALKT